MKIITVNLNPCIDWLCTVSRFTHGGLNRVRRVRSDVAGKGINVAAALKNLGEEPLCTGFNFAENGRLLTQKLEECGVCHDFVSVPGEIRVNMKIREESGIMTEINQPGAFVSEEMQVRLLEKISRENEGILVLSGSRPEGVAADFYAEICKRWSGKIFVDAEGDALKCALETGKVFAVKPNLYELESTFGVKLPNPQEIAAFCRKTLLCHPASNSGGQGGLSPCGGSGAAPPRSFFGVEIVCVSMGADGAVLVTPGGAFFCPALPVQARGLVGAGDAMVAGLVYAAAKNLPREEFLPFAMAAAAASVILEGTQMCTAQGFADMLKKMPKIQQIY